MPDPYGTQIARIAIDIDSTLHHYWDLLERIAMERYSVSIPYADQRDWGITALDREQLIACIEETHTDENIEGAEPYEGSVDAVRRWHQGGHWIHVTSHRREQCVPATRRWLEATGIPYDDLHCSFDKISRCVELGIDVLVDDSPVNLHAAREKGMLGATLIHPWNEELAGEQGIVAAPDWPTLERLVDAALDLTPRT